MSCSQIHRRDAGGSGKYRLSLKRPSRVWIYGKQCQGHQRSHPSGWNWIETDILEKIYFQSSNSYFRQLLPNQSVPQFNHKVRKCMLNQLCKICCDGASSKIYRYVCYSLIYCLPLCFKNSEIKSYVEYTFLLNFFHIFFSVLSGRILFPHCHLGIFLLYLNRIYVGREK